MAEELNLKGLENSVKVVVEVSPIIIAVISLIFTTNIIDRFSTLIFNNSMIYVLLIIAGTLVGSLFSFSLSYLTSKFKNGLLCLSAILAIVELNIGFYFIAFFFPSYLIIAAITEILSLIYLILLISAFTNDFIIALLVSALVIIILALVLNQIIDNGIINSIPFYANTINTGNAIKS